MQSNNSKGAEKGQSVGPMPNSSALPTGIVGSSGSPVAQNTVVIKGGNRAKHSQSK